MGDAIVVRGVVEVGHNPGGRLGGRSFVRIHDGQVVESSEWEGKSFKVHEKARVSILNN